MPVENKSGKQGPGCLSTLLSTLFTYIYFYVRGFLRSKVTSVIETGRVCSGPGGSMVQHSTAPRFVPQTIFVWQRIFPQNGEKTPLWQILQTVFCDNC